MSNQLSRLKKRKKPAEKRVGIVMDSRSQQAVQDAEAAVARLERKNRSMNGKDQDILTQLVEAEDDLETAMEAAAADTEWFVAKAMPPRDYDALVETYPPTQAQQKKARRENPNMSLRWNPDTFPPAVIAACVHLVTKTGKVDPDTGKEIEEHTPLDDAFVKEMFDGLEDGTGQWNIGEVESLTTAAVEANHRGPRGLSGLGNA